MVASAGVGRDFHLMLSVLACGRQNCFVLRLLGRQLIEISVGLRVRGVNLFEFLFRLQRFTESGFDLLLNGARGVEQRLLRQISDLDARHRHRIAFDFMIEARHDSQQRRFARAVQTQHSDLRAGKKLSEIFFRISRLGGTTLPTRIIE